MLGVNSDGLPRHLERLEVELGVPRQHPDDVSCQVAKQLWVEQNMNVEGLLARNMSMFQSLLVQAQ
ncbi:MAG: hypothetical protein EB010_07950 [Acidimicrobiia bacterium]|nr:hypothetical protein [Acidimicrobiia bacterium]